MKEIAVELIQAEAEAEHMGKPARVYRDFRWSTLDSWTPLKTSKWTPLKTRSRLTSGSIISGS